MLSEAEIVKVCALVNRGGTLFVGRDHAGRQKLKIVRGPFGLLTKRLRCSTRDLEKIKDHLAAHGAPDAPPPGFNAAK